MQLQSEGDSANLVFIGVSALAIAYAWLKKPNSRETKCIEQMKIIKEQLSNSAMSVQKCKQVLSLVFQFTMIRVSAHSMSAKKRRNSAKRMEDYLQSLIQGVEETKLVAGKSKFEALNRMGVKMQDFSPFEQEIAGFRKQLKKKYMKQSEQADKISLPTLKNMLHSKVRFFQTEGEKLAEDIISSTEHWPPRKKAYLVRVIPLIIVDKALQGFGEFDESDLEDAKRKYRDYIFEQLELVNTASSSFTQMIIGYLQNE